MENCKNCIPIILAINDAFVTQCCVTVMSICDKCNKTYPIKFYILHSSVTKNNQELLKDTIKKYDSKITIDFIDMNKYVNNEELEKYLNKTKKYNYISLETYYRFFIPSIFQQYNKILYLDSDMIILDDIQELLNINIENYYGGVVLDSLVENFLKDKEKVEIYPKYNWKNYLKIKLHKKDLLYFNAGMLLLNLKKIKQDNIQQKLIKFLIDESPLQYQDQDVLNAVFDGKVKFLDDKYNCFQNSKKNNPLIIHFVGNHKPWNFYKQNEYFEYYWKYLKMSLFWNKDFEQKYNLLRDKYIDYKLFSFTVFSLRQDNKHYKLKILFIHLTINKKWLKLFHKC